MFTQLFFFLLFLCLFIEYKNSYLLLQITTLIEATVKEFDFAYRNTYAVDF